MTKLEESLVAFAQRHFAELNKLYDALLDYGDQFHDGDGEPILTPEAISFDSLLTSMHNLQAEFGNHNECLFVDNGIGSFYDMVEGKNKGE